MNPITKILLALLFVLGSSFVRAQNAEILSQKVVFKQTLLTIDEILKELIHHKKVNLSYSPEALNLKVVIQLPSKEMVIKDVLYLLGFKTGNRVVVIGSQVIIKKDKSFGNEHPPTPTIKPMDTEGPKKIVLLEIPQKDSVFPKMVPQPFVPIKTKSFGATTIDLTKINVKPSAIPQLVSNTKPPVKKVSKKNSYFSSPLFSWRNISMDAGAGIGIGLLSNLKDSDQRTSTTPQICWHLQTDINWWFAKNLFLETGVTFNQKNYAVKKTFLYPIAVDSVGLDSIRYQNIALRLNSLEIPVGVNYVFKVQKSSINIGVGGYYQFAIYGKRVYSTIKKSSSMDILWGNTPLIHQNNISSLMYLNRSDYGLLCQIGYQYNRWKVNLNGRFSSTSFSSHESGKVKQYNITFVYQILSK